MMLRVGVCYFNLLLMEIFCAASVTSQISPFSLDVLKALADKSTPVAVLAFEEEASTLGRAMRNASVPVTFWNCLREGRKEAARAKEKAWNLPSLEGPVCYPTPEKGTRSLCMRNLSAYVMQDGLDFPRPGFIFVPFFEPRSARLFRADIECFETFHSNVHWIFPVSGHEEVLEFFAGHLCQVITVSNAQINAPLDGYTSCHVRQIYTTATNLSLMERTPAAGTYPKNGRVIFARQDSINVSCYNRSDGESEPIQEAYRILNNTMHEVCNYGQSHSLILQKRAHFVVHHPDDVPLNLYYGYAVHRLTSLCFLTQRGGPMTPSFASSWLSFFAVFLVLSPMALVSFLALRYRARKQPRERVGIYAWTMFLVASYTGRSPSRPTMSTSAAVRVTIVFWLLGTFLMVQFTQTEITASRSVPAYSSGVRNIAELTSRVAAGTLMPCMNSIIAAIFRSSGASLASTELLNEAYVECEHQCKSTDLWFDCLRGAQSGTRAIIYFCYPFEEGNDLRSGLVAGEEHLSSQLHLSPVHRRHPRRHQHRRLLRALQESGLVIKAYRDLFSPYQLDAAANFDVPFMNYITIYAIGCSLSLTVFCLEGFFHWRAQRQHH